MSNSVRRLTLASLLVALGVIGGSLFSFTIGVAKVAPMQHLINLVSAVLLGPWWALGQALATSVLRNVMGTGTVLAFPGSLFGAFIAGWVFRWTGSLISTAVGELVGDGIIGALAAYPVAAWFLGSKGALWLFIPSFFMSALVGTIIGYGLLRALWRPVIRPQLDKWRRTRAE
ncbi:energy coupling factor transporter S component ThiW [Levilactobacillus bambusae]|uniref:Energy coupling factor transporter S component ThiW n=1 Tax=Levilactobacillus bambusae TaxID=2024736 RepID=A0A2V1MZW8_9LACO|nr:energy coupling factor transporter S component ThiW [Levilactobacillus bambusae]PWG00313.1 energy coupling factor transporter S component ThiW [Levilactobacillus bambusae]